MSSATFAGDLSLVCESNDFNHNEFAVDTYFDNGRAQMRLNYAGVDYEVMASIDSPYSYKIFIVKQGQQIELKEYEVDIFDHVALNEDVSCYITD